MSELDDRLTAQFRVLAENVKPFEAILKLTVRERDAHYRRQAGWTYTAIGKELGVSQTGAVWLCKRAQKKLDYTGFGRTATCDLRALDAQAQGFETAQAAWNERARQARWRRDMLARLSEQERERVEADEAACRRANEAWEAAEELRRTGRSLLARWPQFVITLGDLGLR